jgi:stearoyl-CoA desaturase (delta-9 desaturase)
MPDPCSPEADLSPPAPAVSGNHRAVTLIVVLVPFFGLIAAVAFSWGWGFGWVDLILLVGMYAITGLGITVGYHRLFAHRSFEALRPVKFVLAVLGSMAVEGPLLKWVAVHRSHHRHSDQPDDPHSPHHFGGGVLGVLAGFWHAHMGWMFTPDRPGLGRYVRDLHADRLLRAVSRTFGVWVLLGLLIPTVLGGWITGSWRGALLGLLWGGLVRILLVHHVTWSVNSICHLWGARPFEGRDESRNNSICGVLALGEGWHNNHHAFPNSARHGLRWWQLDLSYLVIRAMSMVGLVWCVRQPAPETINARRAPARSSLKPASAAERFAAQTLSAD